MRITRQPLKLVPPLLDAICLVVGMSAQAKMRWIAARGIVANPMADD